jgi:hypothetical protein
VPTKKQRRRREKGKRHEYEYVIVDETGEEVPVDPGELRAAKEKDRPAPTAAKGRQPAQARDRKGRPLREPRVPTWQRAIKMGAIFAVVLFLFTSVVGKKKPSLVSRIALAAAYAVVGVPFFYWMDRAAYRRWEKATGRTPAPKKPKES